jgi:hypothetical protein
MSDTNEKAKAAASAGLGILGMVLNGLAFLSFVTGMGVLLYQCYGFVTGNGWMSLNVSDGLAWMGLAVPVPTSMTAMTFVAGILVAVPLALALMLVGLALNKVASLLQSFD